MAVQRDTSEPDSEPDREIKTPGAASRKRGVRSRPTPPSVTPDSDADERARALLLSARSPDDLITRLLDGDPLRLVERSAVRLKQRSLFLDCERVSERAACLVANSKYQRDAPFEDWMVAQIDCAIDDILTKDELRYRKGERAGGDEYSFMLLLFGIADERSLAAAVRFNGQALHTRQAFTLLLIDHWTIAECLEAGYGPQEQLIVRAQTAVAALLECVPKRVKLPKGAGDLP